MYKLSKQAEAINHIKQLLTERGLNTASRKMTLPDSQQWFVFEFNQKQIGIDSASGVWVRESERQDWRCISTPCSVSGAIQAVEFLTSD
jgi:hypothetical protein